MENSDLLLNAKERFEAKNKVIKEIISKYELSVSNNRQKRKELFQLGKFLYCLKSNEIEIANVETESPDFILTVGKSLVGLEIIEIKNESIVKPKTTQELLDKAKVRFKQLYPELKLFATFSFQNEEISFNRKNEITIIEQICEAVYSCYLGINNYPNFITDIQILSLKVLDFSHLWVGYVNELDSDTIKHRIEKKEKLINNYKLNSNTEEQWLLMVIQNGAPNSYDFEFVKEYDYKSKFDRIYLLEEIEPELKRLL
jgi:hypothetical protein